MSINYEFRKEFKNKEVVIDTKPLLILLTGFYNGRGLKNFGKEDDFEILREFVKNKKIFVTPQVLTEVLYFSKGTFGKDYFEDFINFSTNFILRLDEKYIDKNTIIQKDKQILIRFGFTDCSLIEVAIEGKVLLTTDTCLCSYCTKNNVMALTIDELKI